MLRFSTLLVGVFLCTLPLMAQIPYEGDSASFEAAMLQRHNAWRAGVQVRPLQWSDRLYREAYALVEEMRTHACDLDRGFSDYGQNLYLGFADTPQAIIDFWAEDGQYYDARTNTCAEGAYCGSYTQIVWADTRALGCAQTSCGEDQLMLCLYDPPGNMMGEHPFTPNEGSYTPPSVEEEDRADETDYDGSPEEETPPPAFIDQQAERQFYFDLSAHCCSDALHILQKDPAEDFTRWVDDHTEKGLVEAYGLVVHETAHHYDHTLGGWDTSGYYITQGIDLVVPEIAVVNANEITAIIDPQITAGMFYYDLYIGEQSDMGSQLSGIYGILEEFNAYYHGLHAEIQMRQAQVPYADFDHISMEMESYYEFNLFIAWYLRLLQQRYPEAYQQTMGNTRLRLAYTLIDANYARLVQQIQADPVLSRGYSAEMEARFTPTDHAYLQALRLPGASLQNYRQFLD